MTPPISRTAFPAMSTSVELTGVGVPDRAMAHAASEARRLAEAWEQRFSRFRPDSLLCQLNAANGQPFPVDDAFLALLETAFEAVQCTAGRFDPSVLPALEAMGYDRSIEDVRAMPAAFSDNGHLCGAGVSGWSEIRIDRGEGTIMLPPGMRIDLGGIAKGAFVDLLAAEFANWPGGSVDAGGDAVVWGEAPGGMSWMIGIEDPLHPGRDSLIFDAPAGSRFGVATSGTHRRRWRVGGRAVHHLIDPRTGLPTPDRFRNATALAATATAAEIAAKAVLIAASEPSISDLFGASVVALTAADGRVDLLQRTTGNSNDFARLAAAGRAA